MKTPSLAEYILITNNINRHILFYLTNIYIALSRKETLLPIFNRQENKIKYICSTNINIYIADFLKGIFIVAFLKSFVDGYKVQRP